MFDFFLFPVDILVRTRCFSSALTALKLDTNTEASPLLSYVASLRHPRYLSVTSRSASLPASTLCKEEMEETQITPYGPSDAEVVVVGGGISGIITFHDCF